METDNDAKSKITFDEPHWIIYYEGKGNIVPSMKGYPTIKKALEKFIDGIGTTEGIIKIVIETQT